MKKLVFLALLVLPACEDLTFGLGATVRDGETTVSPSVSGRIGDVGVAVSG